MDTAILTKLSYGVYVTSTMDGDRPTGCITNSIMQITASPATIAVSVNHDNYTNMCIQKTGKFAFSVLTENADSTLIGTFGFQSGATANKFDSVPFQMAEGVPVLKDGCGYVVCKVIDKLETATHTIFLGEVIDADLYNSDSPMTYAYYHQVVKGKSPKNAPTYLLETETPAPPSTTKKFVCQVCGYVHEGDEFPEGFKCPVCGRDSDNFKEILE